jgi:hypothetical protein
LGSCLAALMILNSSDSQLTCSDVNAILLSAMNLLSDRYHDILQEY